MQTKRSWYPVTLLLAILLFASSTLVNAQSDSTSPPQNTNTLLVDEVTAASPDAFNVPGNYTIGGSLGIGIDPPQRALHINTTNSANGAVLISNPTNGATSEASIAFTDSDGPLWATGVGGFSTPNTFFIGSSTSGAEVFINESSISFGAQDFKILPSGRGDGGRAIVHDTNDTLVINYGGAIPNNGDFSGGVRIDSALSVNGSIRMGTSDFVILPSGRGDGGRAIVHDINDTLVLNFGAATPNGDFAGGTRIDSNLNVMGDASVRSLQIRGGADLAEPFSMAGYDKIEPGMVVAIDPDHPGRLRVAKTAYDRTVAGVVSGAGGVNSGLVMQHEGTAADGEHPVALTGRVYVWVDATKNPVNPGDLLTTSDTPGHAVKVTDYARAQGAILGKAMSKLETGKGLVLVLVTLQ